MLYLQSYYTFQIMALNGLCGLWTNGRIRHEEAERGITLSRMWLTMQILVYPSLESTPINFNRRGFEVTL